MFKKILIAIAIASCVAIVYVIGLFIVTAENIMQVAVPMSSFNRLSESMNLEHLELGESDNRSEFDIPRHYIYFSGENDEYGRGLIVLRLSFRSLMSWDGRVAGAYQKELGDFTDKFDIVEVTLRQGVPSDVDRYFAHIEEIYKLKKNVDNFYDMSLFDSKNESGEGKFAVYLSPNDHAKYPDMFIEQLSGVNTDRPCTEYAVIGSRIRMEMMFSFQHIADWVTLNEKARRLVEILSHAK